MSDTFNGVSFVTQYYEHLNCAIQFEYAPGQGYCGNWKPVARFKMNTWKMKDLWR